MLITQGDETDLLKFSSWVASLPILHTDNTDWMDFHGSFNVIIQVQCS